ncbi:DUF6551 family protein [Nocardia tengchongensis]|uniref:DUF6551 family protein n=1 Tax=Nocardia tengchongensis TaxID=2055889 RepID=UPI00367D5E88
MPKTKYAFELPKHDVDFGVEVDVDGLLLDSKAQRNINDSHARHIANHIVPEAIGSIVLSQREDGRQYIVDGQHRRAACQLAGIKTIMAEVHHGLSPADEAILFLIKNRESHKPRPIDEYHVGLTGGVPLFVETDRVLTSHGLALGSSSTNSVGAVSGVLQLVDRYGGEVLDRTLSVAEGAWGRRAESWDGMLLGGIGTFLGRHGDGVDDRVLSAKLLKAGTSDKWRSEILSQSSRGGFNNSGTGSRVSTAYRLVVGAWNKGRKADQRIEL